MPEELEVELVAELTDEVLLEQSVCAPPAPVDPQGPGRSERVSQPPAKTDTTSPPATTTPTTSFLDAVALIVHYLVVALSEENCSLSLGIGNACSIAGAKVRG